MDIPKLSEASFKLEVLQASQPVLVEFTAVWCQPCKALDPVVNQLAQEWDGKVKVVKVDVDDNQGLVMDFQVMGVPTLILFVNGKPVQRLNGFQSRDRILSRLSPHIG